MAHSIRKFSQTVNFSRLPFRRLRNHRYFPIAVVVAAVLFFSCLHIWQRFQVMTLVRETALLRERNHELNQVAHKLHDDIAGLSMASRIEIYAADSLGLMRIPPEKMFTLVRERGEREPMSELARIFSSIERVAAYFPTISETEARAGEAPVLILPESNDEEESR